MTFHQKKRRALTAALATAPFAVAPAVLAPLASMLASPVAAKANWPTRPLKMIVGYTPGGFTDTHGASGRGEPLARALGQTMLFDYKPGANSQIGVDMVAKAPADGYTLAGVIAAHAANPALYPRMTWTIRSTTSCRSRSPASRH
jgi:tripartite-type tricarboxylate transporter receptor subunit TctC